MKKGLLKTFLILALLSFCMAFVACTLHMHTFETEYSFDKEYHFHKATCGCNILNDRELHNVENGECAVCGFKDYYYVEYSITYHDELGANNTNPTTFVYIDGEIVLQDLSFKGYAFKGWYTGENGTGERVYTLDCTDMHNKEVFALWEEVFYYELTLILDGTEISNQLEKGKAITKEFLNSYYEFQTGYGINDWFDSAEKVNVYEYDKELYENTTLYATVSYVADSLYFYDYLQEFENAQITESLDVNSFNELKAYVDYVRFYDISAEVKLNILYTNKAGIDEINKAVAQKSNYECTSTITKGTSSSWGETYSYYYVTSTNVSNQASKNANEELINAGEQSSLLVQQDYALKHAPKNERTNTYEGFAINSVAKSIKVSNEDQLYYAVEQGYKPIPLENSKAENVYDVAKDILRSIISDDMSDLTKLKVIYEWLVLNVEYDHSALQLTDYQQTREYNDWFLSGALISKSAVCDGIAKAMVLLCKIEGIPCVRVTGNRHAWNKVFLDADNNGTKEWYGIDATHGSVCLKTDGIEVLSYANFLFTDAKKTSLGYTSSDYSKFVANTNYDYYSTHNFVYNYSVYDLYIESVLDLSKTLKAITSYESNLASQYYTVELRFNVANPETYIDQIFGYTFRWGTIEQSENDCVCILFFEN